MPREIDCKFKTLYDLGLQLLTAAPDSDLGRLTVHHCASREEAEMLLREAISQRTMPDEDTSTRWGILRIFMRNLVNRAQSPMPAHAMRSLLDNISSQFEDELLRTRELGDQLESNERLRQSLMAVMRDGYAPDGCDDYIEWLAARIEEYRDLPVANIAPENVLRQLRQVAHDRPTKIPNIGIALAANLFADLGIRVVGKPDLHVIPTMMGLLGVKSLKPEACIAEIIRISQKEAPILQANRRFDWLDGGLYPRDFDRMIYLIGSDNFCLNGTQRKRCAPKRRQLMLEVLLKNKGSDRHVPIKISTLSGEESREDTPQWLNKWTESSQFLAADFFASRVVFYPGSGTDGQPVQFFGSRHAAHCFLYADYGITREYVQQELGANGHPFVGYVSIGRKELLEHDLIKNVWVPSIKPGAAPQGPLAPMRAYAFVEILQRQPGFDDAHGPRRLAMLFLCADGVAAYDALFCQPKARAPYTVVLQDHGWGGNWTKFGQGGALEQLASRTERLPQLLLVAANTDVWQGYSAIDGAVAGGGGMHGFVRQLWRRDDHADDTSIALNRPDTSENNPAAVVAHPVSRPSVQAPAAISNVDPTPSASELFFRSVQGSPAAIALVSRVISLCQALHVQVHHTRTDSGDLRVRADRTTANPRERNVITMAWKPQKGYFSCQALTSTAEGIEQGLPLDGVRPSTHHLPSRLNIRPSIDDEAFLSIVSLSIRRFREQ
jgi:hypothetical protein